jgi:succinate-semialdehyde dehydrogenase/glutarate-semialdehyde dehydrogenase
MELGGQDAAIVCADADLDVASSGVLFGAFLNAGQACCAIERVYVVESVAARFEELLASKLARVRQGADGTGRSEMEIGPLTVPRQLEQVQRHVADAVSRGATVLAGGPDGTSGRDGLWYMPTILEGRSEDMAMFAEETFGPVLPVVRVRDEEEAIRRANEEGANLTASVWTRDSARGRALASRIKAGTITINDHAVTAATPWGLWGGVGASGYGRLSGKLGLREFAAPVHVATNVVPRLKRLWWYPYDQATTQSLRALAEALSAPKTTQRLRAVMSLAANAGRSLRGKI